MITKLPQKLGNHHQKITAPLQTTIHQHDGYNYRRLKPPEIAILNRLGIVYRTWYDTYMFIVKRNIKLKEAWCVKPVHRWPWRIWITDCIKFHSRYIISEYSIFSDNYNAINVVSPMLISSRIIQHPNAAAALMHRFHLPSPTWVCCFHQQNTKTIYVIRMGFDI